MNHENIKFMLAVSFFMDIVFNFYYNNYIFLLALRILKKFLSKYVKG